MTSSHSGDSFQGESTIWDAPPRSTVSHTPNTSPEHYEVHLDRMQEAFDGTSPLRHSSMPTASDGASAEAVARHNMNFVLRVFRSYIRKMTTEQDLPFIHWSQTHRSTHLPLLKRLVSMDGLGNSRYRREDAMSRELTTMMAEVWIYFNHKPGVQI